MNKDDIHKIVQLRQYVIDEYRKLADPNSATTMTKEQDIGPVMVTVIRSLEDLMGDNVKFENTRKK